MKFYLAPMEGITGYIYRNAYATYFNDIDKYFTPFIATNQNGKLSTKELNDILPEHNKGHIVVPQILSNNAEDFICTVDQLVAFGYNEVNLNLGCPSGTVVAKGKGSGFLAKYEELECFLDKIFAKTSVKISIKTRLGKDDPEEFSDLLKLFNQYPLEELIIHPRVQKDCYKNRPNWEVFKEGCFSSQSTVCYNGDLFSLEAWKIFVEAFPQVDRVMLGRGIISNPGLITEIKSKQLIDKQVLRAFHDQIYRDYQEVLYGERNVLFKMKELWAYMIHSFTHYEKYVKKIRKSQHLSDYEGVISSLFEQQDIVAAKDYFHSTVRR